MRALFRLALPAAMVAVAVVAAEAQEPAPLLKPVTPPMSGTRLRLPTSEEKPEFFHIMARIQDPKKSDKTIEVVVAFDNQPTKSMVTAKKWKSWGFEVPANRIGVLPELIIPASQLAPKLTKGGRDCEYRISNVKVEIVEPPGDADTILLCEMLLSMSDFTKGADRAFETRIYFPDKFIEFTAPNLGVKRLGTGDEKSLPDPAVTRDKDLMAVTGPTTLYYGVPTFAYASVNGQQKYKLPDGKNETVNVGLGTTMNWHDGLLMTIGMARGLGITIEDGKDLKGIGAGFDASVGRAKLKEFRLGFMTGPNLKTPKDLVLKDVSVIVDKGSSTHFMWIGPRFIEANLVDAVYSCDASGTWRLGGRIKPELLQDIKTRTPPPKKP
jgi:hypothetical protein